MLKGENVSQIFKSDLEADVMLNIFKVFLNQDDAWFKDNCGFVGEFMAAMQKVKPFDLACDFLMEDE